MTVEIIQNIYIAQGHAHTAMSQSISTSLVGSRLGEDAKTSLRILAQAHLDAARKMSMLSEEIKRGTT